MENIHDLHILQQYCGDRAKASRLVTGHCDQGGSGWRCYVVPFLIFHGKCRKHGRVGKWNIWKQKYTSYRLAIIFLDPRLFGRKVFVSVETFEKLLRLLATDCETLQVENTQDSTSTRSFATTRRSKKKSNTESKLFGYKLETKLNPPRGKLLEKSHGFRIAWIAWIADGHPGRDFVDFMTQLLWAEPTATRSTLVPGQPRSTPRIKKQSKSNQSLFKQKLQKQNKANHNKRTYQTLQMICKIQNDTHLTKLAPFKFHMRPTQWASWVLSLAPCAFQNLIQYTLLNLPCKIASGSME